MTLLELLLALGLITLVSGMMFMFYDASLRTRESGKQLIVEGHLARAIAERIADEVRSANGFAPAVGPGIAGNDRMITIQTAALPSKDQFARRKIEDPVPPAECDIRQVQYYLGYDQERSFDYPDGTVNAAPLGLVRREIKTLYQAGIFNSRGQQADLDLFSPEMKYLRFRYFDGVDWLDKWEVGGQGGGGASVGNALPQAVEITVGYTELPPKDENKLDLENKDDMPSLPEPYSSRTCTVRVRLRQADTFFGSRMIRAQQKLASGASGTGDTGKAGSAGSGGGGGMGSTGKK